MKTLIECLQIEDVTYTDTTVESVMRLNEFHGQPFGYVNGGAWLAYGEVLAGMGSYYLGQGAYIGVGQMVTGHHMRPKKPTGFVIGKGVLLHGGKRSHTWEISIYDEDGNTLLSKITVVNSLLDIEKTKI